MARQYRRHLATDGLTPRSGSRAWVHTSVVAITAVLLAMLWLHHATGYPVERDAFENLTAAYNLAHHSVISMEPSEAASLRPSAHREPVPIIALAGYMRALDPILGDVPLHAMSEGRYAQILKYSNFLWGALLSLTVFVTVVRFTTSWTLAAAATLATNYALAYQNDFLYSEIAAAALMALSAAVFAGAVARRSLFGMLAAGILFGVLTLTKAAFLYVALPLIAVLGLAGLWRQPFALKSAVMLLIGCALVIAPWLARNYMQFDTVGMSGRGGIVLLTRAIKDRMTPEEYRGAWYAYAPRPLRWAAGRLTGFTREDLEAGGRLQRLMRFVNPADRPAIAAGDPEAAVSYYARAGAMNAQLEQSGPLTPQQVDAALKHRAIEMIRAEPLRHLATTPLYLWRGAPYVFAILICTFVYAWWRRAWWLLAYAAPAFGLVGFYAAVTHFIPRYAEPMWPIAAVCLAVLMHALACRFGSSLAHGRIGSNRQYEASAS